MPLDGATRAAPAAGSAGLSWRSAQVMGELLLPVTLDAGAREFAAAHYKAAALEEFSGDAVGDYAVGCCDWLEDRWDLFPTQQLAELGLERRPGGRENVYATAAVDPHTDELDPLAFLLVLANDGLEFKMGRTRHKTRPGQWFVLDDRKVHEVRATKKTTSYVVRSVQVQKIEK